MNLYTSGERIGGRYEVVKGPAEDRKLMGGMGLVYLCLDHQTQRPVALKTFQLQFLPDRAARDRFLREGGAWVQLGRHPHVVHAYEVAYLEHGQAVFIVLEQVAPPPERSGTSLRAWLRGGQKLPPADALLFALQVARGMDHVMATLPGFVHRDLKPENLLVGADSLPGWGINRLRITDFGLATAAARPEPTQPGQTGNIDESGEVGRTQLTAGIVGTPLYMAPEQWRGELAGVATDVYALGLILSEMVTGQKAVAGRDMAAIRQAHEAARLAPLPAGVHPELVAVLQRCLARSADGRFQSWSALEEALAVTYQVVSQKAAPAATKPEALEQVERIALGWANNSLGAAYIDIDRPEVAARYFQQVRELGEAEGDTPLRLGGLINLGLAYRDQGEVETAVKLHEEALALGQEADNLTAVGAALANLGLAYDDLGQSERAREFHEQHLALSRQRGDVIGEGKALGNLGTIYLQAAEPQRAIPYFEQNLAIARQTGDRVTEGTSLANLGDAYRQLGDTWRVINYYERRLTIARETGDRPAEGNALGALGNAFRRLGDARRSLQYFEGWAVIAHELGDRAGEGKALGNLGIALLQLGYPEQAIPYFEQHMALAGEVGERLEAGQSLSGLGAAQLQLGKTQEALGHLEQALSIARETGDRVGEGKALGNLGAAALQLEDGRRAIDYFEQALTIARETEDQADELQTVAYLGHAYVLAGDSQRALTYYEQNVNLARQLGDRLAEVDARDELGLIYGELGETQRAIESFEAAVRIKTEIGDEAGAAATIHNLALLHAETGDFETAWSLAESAARRFEMLGQGDYAAQSRELAQELRAEAVNWAPPTDEEILAEFDSFIEGVVTAVADDEVRREVAAYFDQLIEDGWRIAGPIERIWAGERETEALSTGLDDDEALVIRAILQRLEETED